MARVDDFLRNIRNIRQGSFIDRKCFRMVPTVGRTICVRVIRKHGIPRPGHGVLAIIEPIRKALLSIECVDCFIDRDILFAVLNRCVIKVCNVVLLRFQ